MDIIVGAVFDNIVTALEFFVSPSTYPSFGVTEQNHSSPTEVSSEMRTVDECPARPA
jgi:hypothetical protein